MSAHRDVDDLLEAERVDVELDRAIGIGDGDADATDLRDVQLGRQRATSGASFSSVLSLRRACGGNSSVATPPGSAKVLVASRG